MSNIHALVLFSVLTAILLAVGWLIGGYWGLVFAFIISIAINFASFWFSDRLVLRMYKARPSNDKRLNSIVEKLAFEAKLPIPRTYLIPAKVPNAFATGRGTKHAAVAVTEGLLELNDAEVEGVIGHELGHIRHRDILTSTMAATIGGTIAYLAQMAYWNMLMGGKDREGSSIIGLIMVVIFAPLAAMLIRLAISRSMEYKADRYAALLTRSPSGLASALKKIETMAKQNPLHASSATSHMWIANPFRQNWFTGLFSTHPPMEKRIKKLEAMSMKEIKAE
ncbi:zinc metalloprotease HtpX [Candidatus Woesearchaeota archaeon]|nr:zinc metalloprotease HtpX [Candidatus Woesearchaeota archaeon]